MNLYFISADDPAGTDDRLDTFIHATDEMSAYGDWLSHFQKEGRLPDHGITPNYDLYLVPYDPHLPLRGIGGIIPWSFDGTGGTGGGTVQLISSSWTKPDRKPVSINAEERVTILTALRHWQQDVGTLSAEIDGICKRLADKP